MHMVTVTVSWACTDELDDVAPARPQHEGTEGASLIPGSQFLHGEMTDVSHHRIKPAETSSRPKSIMHS